MTRRPRLPGRLPGRLVGRLAGRAGALPGDARGVAFLEFALGFPLFLLLVLAGIELANYSIAQYRVGQIAASIADNAGRAQNFIQESDIHEVFAAIPFVAGSIDMKTRGRVILSSIEDNGRTGNDAGQVIRWQRCYGDIDAPSAYGPQGTGASDGTLGKGLGTGATRISAREGTAVIFVEAIYDYRPQFWNAIVGERRIRYESAFNVRDRLDNDLRPSQGVVALTC